MPHVDRAVLDLKNRAIAAVFEVTFPGGQNGTRFDQVESVHFRNPPAFGNADLGFWDRTWDGPALIASGAIGTPSLFPVVSTLPNCRLRNSGCKVSVELFIVRARMTLHIIAHNVGNTNPENLCSHAYHELWPSVRVELRIELGARASFVDAADSVLRRAWSDEGDVDLALINPEDGDGFPTVSPAVDTISYVHPDDGTSFVPPRVVVWNGCLSEFSVPKWRNVWNQEFPCVAAAGPPWLRAVTPNQLGICVARSLNGIRIPGWPSQVASSPEDPHQVFAGSVDLGFNIL